MYTFARGYSAVESEGNENNYSQPGSLSSDAET